MDSFFCPKPRRLHLRNQAEVFISKGGAELIDLIHKEDGIAATQYALDLSSSPPFFSGSPPCRAMNPLIHDAIFANEKQHRVSSTPSPSTSSSPSPSPSCKGRCATARLGKPQPRNRVEGFDCQNACMAAMV
ncbi:hypothetical protein P3L10_013773 [Capsicum annuum]|uniref:uncharacterized protein LOC107868131 n=1 Tax=Capsicum annuum TaxID=4072 RepID=UPI001FB152A9|nr:uncharacterized protein LOC107868131 [Capsicum annuum]